MRHWTRLSIRNWRSSPGRAIASLAAIALGVGTVVSITCFYESVVKSIDDQVVNRWLGRTHLALEPPLGHWGRMDESLAEWIKTVDNVAETSTRLKRRVLFRPVRDGDDVDDPELWGLTNCSDVDAIGIDPKTEYLFRGIHDLHGDRIQPGETGVAIVESTLADTHGLDIGDTFEIATYHKRLTGRFRIVGMFDAQRVAKFQQPNILVPLKDLQRIQKEAGKVSAIDVMLEDHSVKAVEEAKTLILATLADKADGVQITTATARLKQLEEAERITRMILLLIAFIAMLTAFFIILTTMSVGLLERIVQFGMLRCVGMTRRQLAGLVLLEVVPLGVIGTALGLPIGVAIAKIGAMAVPEYVQGVFVSQFGIVLAVVSGLVTIFGCAGALVWQVGRIAPLDATRPEAKPPRKFAAGVAGIVGVLLILLHVRMVEAVPPNVMLDSLPVAFVTMLSIYLGYVLLAPGLVLTIGSVAVAVLSRLVGMRSALARDQVTHSPWRSSSVCWMLMVGLSLIVYIGVRSESIMNAWDFPKRMPESFVWSMNKFPISTEEDVSKIPGVRDYTLVNDFFCKIGTGSNVVTYVELQRKGEGLLEGTFVAGELGRFLSLAKLSFLEGNQKDAEEKLRRGGYVLLPPEAAHTFQVGLDDSIVVVAGGRTATFKVAGVVKSPALDIAVAYFQADSYMMRAASTSVLGTIDDASRLFGADEASMYMLNIELQESNDPPEVFAQDSAPDFRYNEIMGWMIAWRDKLPDERDVLDEIAPVLEKRLEDRANPLTPLARETTLRYATALRGMAPDWSAGNAVERWDMFREKLVLLRVANTIERSDAIVGSVRRLKQQIDRDVRDVCALISAMPAVAMLVAALGVANLMMVGVSARTRQIAVMRAVGATKSQISRLVFIEAASLGLLGAIVGIGLGIHTAYSANRFTERIVGLEIPFTMPWMQIGIGFGLTLLVCIVAAIPPARRASRNNIVDAMNAM